MSTVYLLDSNYWIYGMKAYPLDLFPSFWDKMESHIVNKDVVIHETVLDEIRRKDDALKKWFDSLKSYKPMKTSKNILPDYLEIIDWFKAGLRRPSWIDMVQLYDIDNDGFNIKVIGKLSDRDINRLKEYIRDKEL